MIRLAKNEDLDEIMNIYAIARKYMADNGNPTQWSDTYPSRELLIKDIQNEQLFIDVENNKTHGVFAFIIGPEATYFHIENGSWINADPYGTIHRVASDGAVKGVFRRCLEFCKERMGNLRIDTHPDNHTMQHLIETNDFQKCGIIFVQNGTSRIAYQYAPFQKHTRS